jgi:hypothetical protein
VGCGRHSLVGSVLLPKDIIRRPVLSTLQHPSRCCNHRCTTSYRDQFCRTRHTRCKPRTLRRRPRDCGRRSHNNRRNRKLPHRAMPTPQLTLRNNRHSPARNLGAPHRALHLPIACNRHFGESATPRAVSVLCQQAWLRERDLQTPRFGALKHGEGDAADCLSGGRRGRNVGAVVGLHGGVGEEGAAIRGNVFGVW